MTQITHEKIVRERIWTSFHDRLENYNLMISSHLVWKILCSDIYWAYAEEVTDENLPPENLPWEYLVHPKFFDMSNSDYRSILHHWTNKIYFIGTDIRKSNPEEYENSYHFDFQLSWLYEMARMYPLTHPVWTDIIKLEDFIRDRFSHQPKRLSLKWMISNAISNY